MLESHTNVTLRIKIHIANSIEQHKKKRNKIRVKRNSDVLLEFKN